MANFGCPVIVKTKCIKSIAKGGVVEGQESGLEISNVFILTIADLSDHLPFRDIFW